jgi:hypothetical protein
LQVARSENPKLVTAAQTKKKTAKAEAEIKLAQAHSNARIVMGK